MKIISFELENVKRAALVRMAPNESGLTVIGGKNAAGKTSVLDGIVYALGGEKYRPGNLQRTDGLKVWTKRDGTKEDQNTFKYLQPAKADGDQPF